MQVSKTFARRNYDTQQSGETLGVVPISTRYAFTSKLEAMFATGVVGSLLQKEFTDKGFHHFNSNRSYDLSRIGAKDLYNAVELRQIGFDTPSVMEGVEPLLFIKQSTHLWNAINWVINYSPRDVVPDSFDGFASVVAGAMILKQTIESVEHDTLQAGINLLEAYDTKGFRRWFRPKLSDMVVSHAFETNQQDHPQVTVITENDLLAKIS